MRSAIIAATAKGAKLGQVVQENLPTDMPVHLYVKNEVLPQYADDNVFGYEKLSTAIKENFAAYDALILIMASGIAVRMLAPMIKDKLKDPAVIVMDEGGKFAISLLSGHIGGANELARLIAAKTRALPVITTATDVGGLMAPDAVAAKLNLKPTPRKNIEKLNSAVLAGREISYYVSPKLNNCNFYVKSLKKMGIAVKVERPNNEELAVFVTDESLDADNILLLRPRRLIAGIGCRRGTTAEEILAALSDACGRIGRSLEFVDKIASTEVKAKEAGLIAAAKKLNVPLEFYENEILAKIIKEKKLVESDFVKKTIGIGNVAESAALVTDGILALAKTKYEKVTVALVWEK